MTLATIPNRCNRQRGLAVRSRFLTCLFLFLLSLRLGWVCVWVGAGWVCCWCVFVGVPVVCVCVCACVLSVCVLGVFVWVFVCGCVWVCL